MITLPNELRLTILSFSLHPQEYIDGVFEPKEIDRAVRSIAMDVERGEEERKSFTRRRRNLMLVCRCWYLLASMIFTDQWGLEIRIKAGENHWLVKSEGTTDTECTKFLGPGAEEFTDTATLPVIETQGYDRVGVFYEGETDTQTQLSYTHPIQSLGIKVSNTSLSHSTTLLSLSHILSRPEELRVLHLQTDSNTRAHDLGSYLESFTPNLTILSLDTSVYQMLPRNLSIPSLTSLFLTIPPDSFHQKPDSFYYPAGDYDWKLPLLCNLAIQGHGYRDDLDVVILHPLPGPFESIINNHSDKIASLRVNPPYIDLMNDQLPHCWVNFPNLDAFASNFAADFFTTLPITKRDSTCLTSLRHIIQVPGEGLQLEKSIKGLSKCIELCSALETVTIPWNLSQKQIHDCESRFTYLQTICQQRGLKLLNMDGDEIPFSFKGSVGTFALVD